MNEMPQFYMIFAGKILFPRILWDNSLLYSGV